MEEDGKQPSLMRRLVAYSPIWIPFLFINYVLRPSALNGPLRKALLQPLWIMRNSNKIMLGDFVLLVLMGTYQRGLSGLKFPDWIIEHRVMELQIFSILVLLMIFASLIVLRGEAPPINDSLSEVENVEELLLPPVLLPGKTTHTRLFPQKHSFDYSYLSVGIPVGWKGRAGSLLSANLDLLQPKDRRRGWFNVNASDYLYRGGSELGLEERLCHYLRGEGVADNAWNFAYLVTAPEFLGYSFNPVSFWYIYDNEERLSMMVLEVNNTFGERRIYLLKVEGSAKGESSPPDGSEIPAKGIKFTNAWVKDFHVSPFNSRKGSYSLTATDPLASLRNGEMSLDNLIVLNSSKEHAKLVARVFSEGPPKDPASMSTFEVIKILSAWFWVGFMTFPRIVTQAWILYFKRGLHVWFRPEILASSFGRAHTSTEQTLEPIFREYIASLVEKCSEPLRVKYIPPGSLGAQSVMESTTSTVTASPVDLTLHILTPAFYSRFAHYAHTREALDREGLCTEEKNRTIIITNPQYLTQLLSSPSPNSSAFWLTDRLRWKMLFVLRCPAPAVAYPETSFDPSMTIKDIRAVPPSNLDRFAIAKGGDTADVYRRTLAKLFIAQRFFLGFEGIVSVLDWVVRIGCVALWFKVAPGFNEPLNHESGFWIDVSEWFLVNMLHFWALLKGV